MPVPAREARESARAFRERLDSIPVPLDRVRGMSDIARSGELPAVLPQILAIQVDDVGNMWLKRWPQADVKHTIFDILDPSGAPLKTVRIPADLLSDLLQLATVAAPEGPAERPGAIALQQVLGGQPAGEAGGPPDDEVELSIP